MSMLFDSTTDKLCIPVEDIRCQFTKWILIILPVGLLIFGTFGNILNITLLCREGFRAKPLFILILMSVFDVLFLWALVPFSFLSMTFGTNSYETSPILCKVNVWIGISSCFGSLWTLALVSIERANAVLSHSQRDPLKSRNRNLVILLIIVGVTFTMNGFMVFGYKHGSLLEKKHTNGSSNWSNCSLVSSDFEKYSIVLRITALVLGISFPVVVILIGNAILVTYLCRRQRLFGNQRTSDSQTKIILVLVSCMVITVSPFVIFNMCTYFYLENNLDFPPTLRLIKALLINLFLSNFSLTILCFIWSGRAFRSELKCMLKEIRNSFLHTVTPT